LDSLQVVQFVQRAIKDRRGQVLDLLEHGNVKSMEHYRELMGNLDALNHIAQELSGLLEQQEQYDD
jgi:hypothetical protein|tara:strand:+ start:669 stop:866 length:198 start_codon:yes stop_codon:yes gene_type:complete